MTIELRLLAGTPVLAFCPDPLVDVARTRRYRLKWATGPRGESLRPPSAQAERVRLNATF